MSRTIYTQDSHKELWSLLGLFESNKFVSEKLMERYEQLEPDNLEIRTMNIVYSIRQAREFYDSAEQVTLLTSPLLLSYGMLNLSKALVYYLSDKDTNFNNYFKQHGLTVPYNNDRQSLANEYVKFVGYGTYSHLASIYKENQYKNIKISLKEILSQIPDLREMFILTYDENPRVIPIQKIEYGYSTGNLGGNFQRVWDDIKTMSEIYSNSGYRFEAGNSNIAILKTSAATRKLEESDLIVNSISGIKYFRTIPKVDENLILLKEASLYYLLIFGYGMLARYHATKWGKYIDPNFSKEAELINKSIVIAKHRFLHLVVNLLYNKDIQFKFSIEQINKSKREMADYVYDDVMERLTKELRRHARTMGY